MSNEPTEDDDKFFDEVIEELQRYETLAKLAREALNEGDFQRAIDNLDEGSEFDGDAWQGLIDKVDRLKDIQMRLYEGEEV